MAKKEKKGARGRGRGKALQQIAQTGDTGMVYREFGDRDATDVSKVKSITYRGNTFVQNDKSKNEWGDLHIRALGADVGDYFQHRGSIYRITVSDGTSVRVQI